MKKRIIALLLALTVAVMLLPTAAFAENAPAKKTLTAPKRLTDESETGMTIRVNPLYEGLVTEEQVAAQVSAQTGDARPNAGEIPYLPLEAAVQYVRSCMEGRVNEIELVIYAENAAEDRELADWENDFPCGIMVEAAMAETGVPTQGDYLRWVYGGYGGSYTPTTVNGHRAYYLYFNVFYYTTAEQEKEVDQKLQSVFASFGFTDATDDYNKVSKIYRYLCDNVVYDYEHLYDSDYMLQYTAYAALVQGIAVCQGYATLLYRMLWTAGVPARVVTGGNHAWNSIKVGGLYYFGDTTWDAGAQPSKYYYFLKGIKDFEGHTFELPFDDDYFVEHQHADYKYDYKPGHTHTWDSGTTTSNPSCTEHGAVTFKCACGAQKSSYVPALGHDYADNGKCRRCGNDWGVKLDETSFPDDSLRMWVQETFDTDGNWHLAAEETAMVGGLDLSQSGLTSLKGIEYFTELTLLYCYTNYLTELDVSKLTKLEVLDCSNNFLTKLDVSHNPELWAFYCENNSLTSLDLSKNKQLYDSVVSVQQVFDVPEYECGGKYLIKLDGIMSPEDISKITSVTAGTLSVQEQAIVSDEYLHIVEFTASTGNASYPLIVDLYPAYAGSLGKFSDIGGHWAQESILYMVERGIMSGVGDRKFDPDGTVTRAMVAVMLHNLSGEPAPTIQNPFSDVHSGDWFAQSVTWAYENGIVSGYEDGTFLPDAKITREQLATMMANYAEFCGESITPSGDLSRFADAQEVSPWAIDSVRWAVSVGLINGSDENGRLWLDPQSNATRAQIAVIFQNFCESFGI